MTKEELQNYEPKGQLEGFPKEIIARMLDYQEEQGNKRDISVFERWITSGNSGFDWRYTKENFDFWKQVISNKDFNLFFEKYPKKEDNSQEFKVDDKVIDIITGKRGKVTNINKDNYSIFVNFNEAGLTLDGRNYSDDKYPRLLHYRDDYDYSVIDFNNLPKRQELKKRWRAEKGGFYYFVAFNIKKWFFLNVTKDDYVIFDDDNYNSGNYFRSEAEAEIIAQKLNSYFK